ncbi:TraG family conjugative transposon ATPase [Bacteroides fragilis]|uniref:TraG family conjugative transposon ATPase n=1 Tax=Bacteroides fragilis TaxID=817 RepID=UPI001C6FDAF9|nr:TraG family conjugative transposon ATPase [Bacteroides fragilis]MBW9280234.1 TraG family conjugative transposon ATPase [Bacteroides fragilis]
MEITSRQAYSILGFIGGDNGVIISKTGVMTVAYSLKLPEAYSLYFSDMEVRHSLFYQAFKNLPDGTFVHKQDVFLKESYVPKEEPISFLGKAQDQYFRGREFLRHQCILAFSIGNMEELEKKYVENPLAYNEHISHKTRQKITSFLESVETAVNILKNISNMAVKQLSVSDIKEYIYRFSNGFMEDNGLRDIHFAEKMTIGENKYKFFAVCDEEFLPDSVANYVEDTTLPMAASKLYMSNFERLGVHLNCNHVYNQVIWFEGSEKLRNDLNNKVLIYGQNQRWGTKIEQHHKKLVEMEKEIVENGSVLCRAHFNVMIWDEKEENLRDAEKKIKSILDIADYKCYIPSYEGIYNLFVGNIIGRENKLDPGYFFLTDLDVALSLGICYTTFSDDKDGIFFNDRIFQVPLKKDIWDAEKKRIPARNGIVFANTGGGKSFLTLSICQQYIEQNVTTIVCEFGKSFEQLCYLYPEKSLHIDYDGKTPLGINPFDLEGEELNDEKLETLIGIVLKFWRVRNIVEDTNQTVSLSKLILAYYQDCEAPHSFPGFYTYVKDHFDDICERYNIDKDYFEIKSFLHICSEFIPGGRYENVCKAGDTLRGLSEKSFIVFELTQIKSNPFLTSLVMTILFDVIKHKILADRSKKGILIFDEYAETAQMKDKQMDADIHSVVAFCYQKFRKENGAVMTIVQTPAQLPNNEFTDGIIANTQLLFVLPTTEVIYDEIIAKFKIKNEAHINQMKSIRNDFVSKRPYSECWIRFGERYALAVRLETSKEKYYAFQTEGEDYVGIHTLYRENGGDMEKAITDYITIKKNKQ